MAGEYAVAYQSCDDATAQAGAWDSAKCSSNAAAYAENDAMVGMIGTFNSGCVKLIIPVLNRAPDGPLGIVSPSNTYVGLTHSGPGTVSGEPDIYYPTGKRNFIRVVAADDYQGAADAMFIKKLGVKRIYFLNDKDNYGFGVATNTRNALTTLGGVEVAGFAAWDTRASSYEALAGRIRDAGADGVFLGGVIDHNGGKLIKDLRTVLGPEMPIFTPDGFTPVSAVVSGAGAAAEGVYLSIAGLPLAQLGEAGKAFVERFGAEVGGQPQVYAAYAAQAANVLLDAIAASDGTRASVNENLLKTNVTDGILGTFAIDENGDTNANPVTMYQIRGGEQTTGRGDHAAGEPGGGLLEGDGAGGGGAVAGPAIGAPRRSLLDLLPRRPGRLATRAATVVLLGCLAVWLVGNFLQAPPSFLSILLIGITNGAIFGLIALGYTLVYGILELINFAHGEVFMLGGMMSATLALGAFSLVQRRAGARALPGAGGHAADLDGVLRRPERAHRAGGLPAAAQRAPAGAADHRGGHLLHPPERRPALEGPGIRVAAAAAAERGDLLARRRRLHLGQADRAAGDRPGAARPDPAGPAHPRRQGHAGHRPGPRGGPR